MLQAAESLLGKGFGEAEYWFAGIKVVVTIIFPIVGVLMIIGIMNSGEGSRFPHWTLDGGEAGKRRLSMESGVSSVC